MGWVGMSERDLYRFGVLSEVICGARSLTSAAEMLEISPRQAHRLLSRLREGGPGALVHRARGRPSNNRLAGDLRQRAMALIGERYSDFGPTLAAEMLAAHHGLTVSRETLRHWMNRPGFAGASAVQCCPIELPVVGGDCP